MVGENNISILLPLYGFCPSPGSFTVLRSLLLGTQFFSNFFLLPHTLPLLCLTLLLFVSILCPLSGVSIVFCSFISPFFKKSLSLSLVVFLWCPLIFPSHSLLLFQSTPHFLLALPLCFALFSLSLPASLIPFLAALLLSSLFSSCLLPSACYECFTAQGEKEATSHIQPAQTTIPQQQKQLQLPSGEGEMRK